MSRSFGQEGPQKPHLVRGTGGLAGEVSDLRGDVETAFTSLEGDLDGTILRILMDDPEPAAGGATTTTVGFQLVDGGDNVVAKEALVEFAVFDDEWCADPAINAIMDTATEGTIVGGAGTKALKVETGANGRFTCTLTNTVDETNYLACNSTYKGPALNCESFASVVFSA